MIMEIKWKAMFLVMMFLLTNNSVLSDSCNQLFLKMTSSQLYHNEAYHTSKDANINNDTLHEDIKEIEKISEYELQEIISGTIETLLIYNQTDKKLLPDGTKLNKVIVIDKSLLLDFSEELLDYGGTQREKELVNQLLDIAFGFKEINKISIAINGEVKNLVEGTLINGYTREKWEKEK